MGVRAGIVLALAAAVSACADAAPVGTTEMPMTTTTTVGTTTTVDPFPGFGRTVVVVSGEPWTVAVADTVALQSQGLMGVADLGELDGMLFVFGGDTGAGFWMKDTLIPLDVAFFASDGSFVDLLSMEPCTEDPCSVYRASGLYRYALEARPGAFGVDARPTLGLTEG
jgi:uncharacterized membrane protein (UPF0127 family)